MEDADLVLLMLNNNEELDEETIDIISKLKNKNVIYIVNKTDLESKIDYSKLPVDKDSVINMSVKNNQGIDELKNRIIEMYNLKDINSSELIYLTNARSISILKNCLSKTEEVENAVKNNIPIDMIELDVKGIWEELGKINGTTYEEELLDEMFKRFCLGK